MEGPSWEMLLSFLSPSVVLGLRISAKEWNHTEKYEPYDELFFFLMKKDSDDTDVSAPLDLCEFMRVVEKDSLAQSSDPSCVQHSRSWNRSSHQSTVVSGSTLPQRKSLSFQGSRSPSLEISDRKPSPATFHLNT